ncbi:2-polyprenyl-3-methyl-6-methoxy-1,4-benzoquinone monooxygenase [Microbulbifer sp. YPW16]|uniref:2-polyprenyl-3-methyl-6-methoxy-1,4-benzoquinone monooxygenase n=1 Tax=unclassified Microbulbifer TaxID=2619833 RepID=UPI001E5A4067|nr:2-polyprenyl-3-methyl-6-methoxy-1,4-benzoquinone monooxygenase [Microbulbifer sp. YPW16]UHQ54431.1 2-polyprenyl-3-methyl-6-methoxy-1,4-benzoquinone monooxygenase [Microbulbifer sp. YPW16]
MSRERQLTGLDRLLLQADRALRTLSPGAPSHPRPSPARGCEEPELNERERRHVAGLMRVNHSGEVCAQALYQGQALTAKLPDVREEMEHAAEEEVDHLAWCEQRLRELDSRPSLLNPVWYGLSFGLGAAAGKVSDRVSLGFVAATEEQVCKHLDSHLEQLPAQDSKSRAIVEQMREDEAEHQHAALAAGGARFPAPVKGLMTLVSKVMTSASYRV